MSPRRSCVPFVLALASLASLLWTAGCVQVYGPQPTTSAEKAGQPATKEKGPEKDAKKDKDEKEPFKPWEEVLKDTQAIDGFFKFHLGRDQTLYLELPPDRLDQDFGLMMHFDRGVGDLNLHEGLPLSGAQLMRLRRVGDRIYLVKRNPRFTAEPGSPMEKALEENVAHGIVGSFKIASEHKETKHVLADVTKFFVSDYAGVSYWIKPYYGDKPASLDAERSFVGRVQGFPKNVEIDAELTYTASEAPKMGGEGLIDFRVIPVGVRYSLFALPEKPMTPRLGDDRVGHFLVAVKDFSRDQEETNYVRYVRRWRLEKKDPTAEISEPIQPIVFYIDRSVPREYQRYVREGIEGWNKAFETAGFRNAIVAQEAPEDDPTWSAEDIRYSTVRWTAAHRMGYAIGPSQADPRTGELLNADILISSEFVRGWLFDYQELAAPDEMFARHRRMEEMARTLPAGLGAYACHLQAGKAHQLALQYTLLTGMGVLRPGEPMPEEFLGDAIRDLVLHEVGHTLGLRHNFKSSSGVPFERLHDPDFTRQNGVTLSVMDYAPVNVAADREKQGHYWNQEVGSYDLWAIQYAYAPVYEQTPEEPFARTGKSVKRPEDELVGLEKIARQVADPLHTYGTDEDNWLGPYTVDPLTNAWDLGSDPLLHATERMTLINGVLPRLEDRLIPEGKGYQRLRGAFNSLLFERFIVLWNANRTVGGLYFARDHKGDPGARPPFTPVPAERQRQAVRLIVDSAFAEGAFRFDPELLNKLAPNRWAHWGMPFFITPVEMPIHATVLFIQRLLLEDLLHPARLGRILDNEVRVPRGENPYAASELFDTLTSSVWSEVAGAPRRGRPIDSFRRGLQRLHLDQLSRLLLETPSGPDAPPIPQDARALARYELGRISGWIDGALAGGERLDTYTRAHLAESKARIHRALEASVALQVQGGM